MVKLFEKTKDGLLVEVNPADVERVRAGRRVNRVVNAQYDVLYTAEEEATRDAEDVEFAAATERRNAEASRRDQERAATHAKLRELGLDPVALRETLRD